MIVGPAQCEKPNRSGLLFHEHFDDVLFRDDKWHCIEAMFQLNGLDLQADKPNTDGVVRGWFDGKLVIEQTDVVLRSTDFPCMKFN